MGDTGLNTRDQQSESRPDTNNNRTSMERLHEAKPSENISINSMTTEEKEGKAVAIKSSPPIVTAKIETVFEKLDMNSDKSDSTTDADDGEKGTRIDANKTETPTLEAMTRSQTKNDELGVDEVVNIAAVSKDVHKTMSVLSGKSYKQRDMSSTVFPVGIMGCKDSTEPYRRFMDAKEACQDYVGHLENTPRKRPPSEKKESRNPLTGAGIHSDDVRRTSSRKKDGNPLLGLGYDDSKLTMPRAKNPPGGFSNGLW